MKRIGLISAAVILAVSSLGVIAPHAYAATGPCVWTGAGGDNKFSTAGNWTTCLGSVPQAGDGIEFDDLLPSDVLLTNDLGVDFGMVAVVAQPYVAGKSGVYQFDTLSLQDNALITIQQASVCNYAYPHIGVSTLTAKGALTANQWAFSSLNSPTMAVSGVLTLTGGYGNNSFKTGSTASSIVLASPASLTSATDCGGAGGTGGGSVDELANFTYGSLTVQKGASVELRNITRQMTLGGGTGNDPQIFFNANVDGSYNEISTTHTWSGAVTLLSNATVYVNSNTTVNYTGAITGSGFALARNAFNAGTFNFNPSSNDTASQVGTQVNPVKATPLDGVVAASISVAGNETATLNGTRDYASVFAGGVLKGSGTVTGGIFVSADGIVAPGNSPGCLTTDTLSLSGIYQFELGGATPCTEYDQLVVKNASNNANAVNIDNTTATLTTSRYNNYTPKQNDVFIIINQSGDKPIVGTFKALPEGATFTENGIVFKISYVGGDGNDVTLTVQNVPTAPNTGAMVLWTNPMLIAGVAMFGALILAGLARMTAKRR